MIIIGTLIAGADIDTLWEKTIRDLKKEFPTYFDEVTVRDAIGNLLMRKYGLRTQTHHSSLNSSSANILT